VSDGKRIAASRKPWRALEDDGPGGMRGWAMVVCPGVTRDAELLDTLTMLNGIGLATFACTADPVDSVSLLPMIHRADEVVFLLPHTPTDPPEVFSQRVEPWIAQALGTAHAWRKRPPWVDLGKAWRGVLVDSDEVVVRKLRPDGRPVGNQAALISVSITMDGGGS
jgi:hypothetical protein